MRERGLVLVCVQPLVSHIAREQQDYTTHKRDESDAVLIARLACELHCYVPEVLDESWALLRQLGRRREQLMTAATAAVLRVRDFLSLACPSAQAACRCPFVSVTWLAAMQAVASAVRGGSGAAGCPGRGGVRGAGAGRGRGWGAGRGRPAGCARAVFAALADERGRGGLVAARPVPPRRRRAG